MKSVAVLIYDMGKGWQNLRFENTYHRDKLVKIYYHQICRIWCYYLYVKITQFIFILCCKNILHYFNKSNRIDYIECHKTIDVKEKNATKTE